MPLVDPPKMAPDDFEMARERNSPEVIVTGSQFMPSLLDLYTPEVTAANTLPLGLVASPNT
jgi:hypothetical protein